MRVITTQSLLQVTVVAGPPVEVQVRVLDWLLTVRLVTLGEPAWRYKQKVQMKFWTDHYKPGWSHWGPSLIPRLMSSFGARVRLGKTLK